MGSRTYIMGIMNITQIVFWRWTVGKKEESDLDKTNYVESALNYARKIIEEGADIVDIGGRAHAPELIR